ncbi:MAG TPA: type II CAAX endopeptidase family protein [Candidatus Acidoferrum sp.]|nr:type II CAAX endopeptidase family protein [Candidatus Acidoferrum sp.]
MDDRWLDTTGETIRAGKSGKHEFPANLFLTAKGIRAGWRLLIFATVFFTLWMVAIFTVGAILRPAPGVFSPSFQFFGELASFIAALIAAWIMSGLEQQPFGMYGLPARGMFGKLFLLGGLFGLSEISLLIGILAACGSYSFGHVTEHGSELAKWALFWAGFFLVVACTEEFLFRGYALYTLAQGVRFWPAAVLLAAGFGGVHYRNPGENWTGVASVFLVGLFWSFTVKRTGTLWFALGMHACFDFSETFLFSVPDSGMVFPGHLSNAALHGPAWLTGGTAGPEASVFDFAILILFFVAIHFLFPAKPSSGGQQTD